MFSRYGSRLFPLTAVLLLTFGCVTAQKPQRPDPTENLRTSLKIMRGALREITQDRDQFQQKYVAVLGEVEAQNGDLKSLEVAYRVNALLLERSRKELEEMRGELQVERDRARAFQTRVQRLGDEKATLAGQLKQGAVKRGELQRGRESTTRVRQELRKQLEALEDELQKKSKEYQRTLAAKEGKREVLQGEVERLKRELVVARTRSAPREAPKVAPREAPQAESPDAVQALVAWVKRSTREYARGDWNRDNLILAGMVAAALFLFLVALLSRRSARRWKQLYREQPSGAGKVREPAALAEEIFEEAEPILVPPRQGLSSRPRAAKKTRVEEPADNIVVQGKGPTPRAAEIKPRPKPAKPVEVPQRKSEPEGLPSMDGSVESLLAPQEDSRQEAPTKPPRRSQTSAKPDLNVVKEPSIPKPEVKRDVSSRASLPNSQVKPKPETKPAPLKPSKPEDDDQLLADLEQVISENL
ncbi:MAG: hypothetical protein V3T77_02285 [Planctomycetota bacterium]